MDVCVDWLVRGFETDLAAASKKGKRKGATAVCHRMFNCNRNFFKEPKPVLAIRYIEKIMVKVLQTSDVTNAYILRRVE